MAARGSALTSGHEKRPRDGEGEMEWGDFVLKSGGLGRVGSRIQTDVGGRTDARVEIFRKNK